MKRKYLSIILFFLFCYCIADDVYQAPDVEPTAEETYSLELLNRFRLDPKAEAELIAPGGQKSDDQRGGRGVDYKMFYNEMLALTPAPPLVMNLNLLDAARKHSYYMIKNSMTHVEVAGNPGFVAADFGERCKLAGYHGGAMGENCFRDAREPLQGHNGFIIDYGEGGEGGMQAGRGHRMNMIKASAREIGLSVLPHSGKISITHNFGSGKGARFAGGVVYRDKNKNGFYDIGEGVGGVKIASLDGKQETITWKSGGYALPLNEKGAIKLVASLAGTKFEGSFSAGGENIKFDWAIPEEQEIAKMRTMLASVGAIEDTPANKRKLYQAKIKLYLEGADLGMGPEEKQKFDEFVKEVKPKIEEDQKKVRGLFVLEDNKEFKKVITDLKTEYSGSALSGWLDDSYYTNTVKQTVSTFVKNAEASPKKISTSAKKDFQRVLEASKKKVKSPEYLKMFDNYINQIEGLGK
jgi:hypothetical protein